MLRVVLDGDVMGRQDAMVAYQGQVDFAYQARAAWGVSEEDFTGEGMPLMKVLDAVTSSSLTTRWRSTLSTSRTTLRRSTTATSSLRLDPCVGHRAGGGGVDDGRRRLRHHVHRHRHRRHHLGRSGRPQRRRADVRRHPGTIACSSSLTMAVRRTAGAGALIGRGSGEAFELGFSGQGFVVVQASEGRVVAPHSH